MFRKIFISIGLMAISVAVGVLLLEFGVRILLPQYDPSGQIRFTRLDDGTPIGPANETLVQIKNTGDFSVDVTFNKYGFRDDKDLAAATDDSIFVVGDSFSFGWGVEQSERYSNVLQEMTGRKVFNISIPTDLEGYEQLVAYAKRKGAQINSLIIGLCMENDIRRYGVQQTETPAATQGSSIGYLGLVKGWLQAHSALYFYLTTVVQTQPWLRDQFVRAGLIIPNLEGIQAPELDPKAFTSSVERLVTLAGGQKTMILVIPSRWLWVGESTRRQAVSELHDRMVAELRSRGLQVVDPRAFMETNGPPLKYHFKNDGHWRAEMHRIAAKMLAEKIPS